MIDLSLLKHFVAVVDTGSFTRAAERLHTSQSGLSRAISRLEDELGVVLLERTTRKLRLTPAGEALFSQASASLDRIAVAADDARRIGHGAHACLRIGICQAVAQDTPLIQRGLQAFRTRWPDVELRLTTVLGLHQAERLRSSMLDLGLRAVNPADSYDLAWKVLSRRPLTVAIPLSWDLANDPIQLGDLRDRPWILPDPNLASAAYQGMIQLLRAAGFDPKIGGLADDRLTAQIMLACGMGAALGHSPVGCNEADGYTVLPLQLPPPGSDTETVVCWSASSTSDQIACLVACLCDAAAGEVRYHAPQTTSGPTQSADRGSFAT